MFAASKSGSVDAKDPQFNYVTMLLHGDGTNGSQNNTFLDSSTNNFTITRNGNTTQGTFTPYGSNWSNFFPTISSDYLKVADNSAWDLGSNDFTIECLAFGINSTTNQSLLSQWVTANDANSSWQLMFSSGGGLYPQAAVNNGSVNSITSSTALSLNVWNHIAMTKSSTTFSLFLNGTRVATTTVSGSVISSSNAVGIGVRGGSNDYGFSGYISNARIVNGTAVYDATQSTITVPTTPLTAVTNTKLLTCQGNRFFDASSNALAITTTGSPSVQRFSPFSPTTAYSTSVIGGSGYFDGSGDYLSLSQQTALSYGTGDFTIEAWVYPTSLISFYAVLDTRGPPSTSGSLPYIFGLRNSSGAYKVELFLSDPVRYLASTTVPLNAWTHIAVSRSSGTLRIFVNGAVDRTDTGVTGSIDAYGATQSVGAIFDPLYDLGYITNLRVVKGTAVYTSAFTPPTAPLTAVSNTQLLLNYTNGAIFDNAMMNDLETVGNAQISTSVKKYGTGSIAFDGSGDWVSAISSPNYGYGTGDFTIEFWVYPTSSAGTQVFLDQRTGTVTRVAPTIYTSASVVYYYVNGNNRISGTSPSLNQWSHFAISRSGTSTKMFINGTQIGSTYTDTFDYVASPVRIGDGNDGAGPYPYSGYIDDLRITKVARYTANFTAPTQAFADKG